MARGFFLKVLTNLLKNVAALAINIFARLIMYNFSELIISHVTMEEKDRKYAYKANFFVAVHICRELLFRKIVHPISKH